MCYGSLDPKYLMRDIEARVKSDWIHQDGGAVRQPSAIWAALVRAGRHLSAAFGQRPAVGAVPCGAESLELPQ